MVNTLATPEGEEVFDPSYLGECDEVDEEAVGDNDFIFFKGCKKSTACTIILRGANEYMLDEVERYIIHHLDLYTILSVWQKEPLNQAKLFLEEELSILL